MNDQRDPIELKLEALKYGGKGESSDDTPSCPSDEIFGAFMDGKLTGEELTRFSHHLATCPECHQIYQAWKETEGVEGPAVPAKLIQAARDLIKPGLTRIVLEMVKEALKPLNPGDLTFLHSQDSVSLGVARGKAEVQTPGEAAETLAIRPDLPLIDALRMQLLEKESLLRVSLHPDQNMAEEELKGIRVDLYQDSDLLQSWPLTISGAILNPIGKGVYRIELLRITSSPETRSLRPLGSMELDLRGD